MSSNPRLLLASVLLGLVAVIGPARTTAVLAEDEITLTDFLVRYLKTDSGLAASLLRVEASERRMSGKRYLAPPGLQLSITSPYYSYGRLYDNLYNAKDSTTYRGFYQSKLRSHLMSLTLRQPLPTGGNLSLTGSASKRSSDFSSEGFPEDATYSREAGDEEFSTDVGFSLDQPLFGPWERRNEIRKASLEYEIKAAQHKIDAAAGMKKAVNLFFDYLIGAYRLETEERRLDRAVHEAEAAIKQFGEFLISETDVLEKQVAANDARIKHFEARTAFDRALRQLRVVTPTATGDLTPEDLGEVLFADAADRSAPSPEVVKAGYDVEVARIGLAETRRRRYGRPAVSLWYGFQGVGDDFRQARDEFEKNRWGGSLSLGFTFPEPGLSSDIGLAQATLKTAESAHEDAIQIAVEERAHLAAQITALRTRLELQTRQVELLEQMLVTKRTQYAQDVISLNEFVDSETGLFNAKIARLETLRKLNLAWVDLVLKRGRNPVEVLGIKG
ncbi:MAG: TolC family protein [Candidatus Eisenbacteria bacterium]